MRRIPATGEIAISAAHDWRDFRQQGITLGRADALIGATARVLGHALVTCNRDHYPMPDITLYDPMPPL